MLDAKKIENLILTEKKLHPEAQLIDYYKLFFQGHFGPGHLIENIEEAFYYLKSEVENTQIFDKPLFQDISFTENIYRINLILVKENKISINDFFSAFINSSKRIAYKDIEEWKNMWYEIKKIIDKFDICLDHYTEDRDKIDKILNTKNVSLRHSENYRKKYNPHYRIILKEEILKYINLEGIINVY